MAIKKETTDHLGMERDYSLESGHDQKYPYEVLFKEIGCSQIFFDLLDHFVLMLDGEKKIILSNKKAQDYLGLSKKEINDTNFLDLCVKDEEKERIGNFLSSVISGYVEKSAHLEMSIKDFSGEDNIFELNTKLIKDTESLKKALLVSLTYIPQKDCYEYDPPDNELLLNHLDSIPYSMVLSDSTGMITFWNLRSIKLFGYEKDEIIGKHITLIMPKRYRKAHEGWDELISIGKSPVVGRVIEVTGLRKDGTEFPIELAVTTTRIKGNIFHGAIINDISKRKMKERLMNIAKNKYRMIFEKSPLGIFHFDEKGVITQCNEKLVKILGVPEENIISRIIGFNIVESFSDDISIKKAIKQVLAGISSSYEDEFVSPFSDKIIPIKAEFSPVVSEEGKFMGGVCVVEDFTERRVAEKALNKYAEDLAKANKELKSLDRMKDEFISNLRHELKTPLIPIKGYSELMYEGSLGELNRKQKDAMEKVMLSSERLKRRIDSLLYLSITEGGNVEYSFSALKICEVIDAAVHDRYPEITSRGHKFENSVPLDIPLIDGDLDYLKEVFVNILDNSIKFMEDGGTISISAIFQDDNKVHLIISDDGIGIAQEHLTQIFNRFYQIDGSSTRKYGGNGLGLYICKKIIEAHRGDIWAESKEGSGTTIHILLPVK